jgi:hypothetical protein
MRTHGLPQFPDPAFTPPQNARSVLFIHGMVFAFPSGVGPQSPAFKRAAAMCRPGA